MIYGVLNQKKKKNLRKNQKCFVGAIVISLYWFMVLCVEFVVSLCVECVGTLCGEFVEPLCVEVVIVSLEDGGKVMD